MTAAVRPWRADPYRSFRFKVEIGQAVVAAFTEVTGLAAETEVETFREGGVNGHERQLPGPTKYGARLVLKRGLGDADGLWSWFEQVARGEIVRKDVSILLMNSGDEERRRWSFAAACPVKWSGPDLRANASEVAFESVELVHRGLLGLR